MVIFLDRNADKTDYTRIEKAIRNTGNVESLVFKSKQESAEDTAKENEVFQTIVDTWTEETNPLLDSFELKVSDVDKIKETAVSEGMSSLKASAGYYVKEGITSFNEMMKIAYEAS